MYLHAVIYSCFKHFWKPPNVTSYNTTFKWLEPLFASLEWHYSTMFVEFMLHKQWLKCWVLWCSFGCPCRAALEADCVCHTWVSACLYFSLLTIALSGISLWCMMLCQWEWLPTTTGFWVFILEHVLLPAVCVYFGGIHICWGCCAV